MEIEWSAEANLGLAAIEVTDGKEPVDMADSQSIPLLPLHADKYAPLFSQRQRVWIDICGQTNTATVYTPEGVPRGGAAIDLSRLSVWKLRFFVKAGTSAGFPPSHVVARIYRVCAKQVPPRSAVSGRVVDAISNRGIPGAVVRVGSDKVVSNPDGTFLLRTAPGKEPLHADATGYEETDPKVISIEPGRRTVADVSMKRTRFQYGNVVDSIAMRPQVQSFALAPKDIYFTLDRGGGIHVLFQMPIAGGHETELGTIALSRAERHSRDAFTIGTFSLSVPVGLTWDDGVLYGIEAWPGRIFRVASNGELSFIRRLQINWPVSIVLHDKRYWFLENSGIDNRYGIHAVDSETGKEVLRIPTSDKKISGLAWGLNRFWVSSLAGHVYEIDMEQAIERKSLEAGAVNRFSGQYERLGFSDSCLWGLDRDAQRLCKIKVRGD